MAKHNRSWSSFIKEFHEKFDCPIGDKASMPDTIISRKKLIDEEYAEVVDAFTQLIAARDAKDTWPERFSEVKPDLMAKYRGELLKELADLVYVCIGAAVALGLDIDTAMTMVHGNNMEKLWADGKVHYNKDGKVLKPEGFKKVDLTALVQ